jgi:predicted nucleic acid-binding protein
VPSASDRHFIDTNVFVYAAGSMPVRKSEVAALQAGSRRVIEALAADDLVAVTSLTVLQEIIYLMARWQRQHAATGGTHRQSDMHAAGCQIVRSALVLVDEVLSPSVLEFSRALEAHGSRHDFNDLLIVETMRAHRITTIISADRHFEHLGVTRRDPSEWA